MLGNDQSLGSDSATHLSAANRFPISNSIAFLYWVCSQTTCWNRLWKNKIYFGYLWNINASFFIQIEGKSCQSPIFSKFQGYHLIWLQSYCHRGHFSTSARLLGTNLELFPLLPLHLVLLFQNKMSTRCVGVTGCYSARLWSTPSSTGSRGNKGRSPKLAPSSLAPGQKCPRRP